MFLWIPVGLVAALALLRWVGALRYRGYVAWETEHRKGLNYYGEPLARRRAFRKQIRARSRGLMPFLCFEAHLQKVGIKVHSFEYEGVWGPRYSCSPETFRAAAAYRPTAQDLFIAAPMRCGTTWMQQVVYEILHKGAGDLGDVGHIHLNAVSPWIEAFDGVPMEKAPLLGGSRRRIIKTHLPTQLCPYGAEARYLYITRHPVSCFASIADYFRLMAGPLSPPREELVDWFCSDRFWWLPWPDHVAGWWDWSQQRKNVLFVHFEEMKRDLEGTVRQVARFLVEDLSDEQVRQVTCKSTFQYMKENEELFEMSPPNLFSVNGNYFKSGQADRFRDVSEAERCRILNFCKEGLKASSYPAERFYPDVPTRAADKRVDQVSTGFCRASVAAGNFFFKHRNALFPVAFAVLLLMMRPRVLFGRPRLDEALVRCGYAVALLGELVRLMTIGFEYIERGGKQGKVYASSLVRKGVYGLCRNPMYVGNLLICIGITLASGSPLAYATAIPFFAFVYHAITSAEEEFLRAKFGPAYDEYCARVPRFLPALGGFREAFSGTRFDFRRPVKQDLSTLAWISMVLVFLPLWRAYFLYGWTSSVRWMALRTAWTETAALLLYGLLVLLKRRKSGLFYEKEN